jgi:hypothetical protein
LFVATRTDNEPRLGNADAAVTPERPEKFYIFHQRHFGETADLLEYRAPAKESVIATTHPQQSAGVMSKRIGQAVNEFRPRQPNAKKTASTFGVAKYLLDGSNAADRWPHIRVQKPEYVASGRARTGIHLNRPAAFAREQTIAQRSRNLSGGIETSAIDDDDFRMRRDRAEIPQKIVNVARFIKDRHYDGNGHILTGTLAKVAQ